MKIINQHLVKNKKKQIIHCYFLVRYSSHVYGSDKVDYTFKIISSLPVPFAMIFFENTSEPSENHFHQAEYDNYRDAFRKFTDFIKYTSKYDIERYGMPDIWEKELKKSPEFIDNLKSVWLGQLPPVTVASPTINSEMFWSISNDIVCLKEMLPDLYRNETDKVSRKDFEGNLNCMYQKNEYIEYFYKFNDNFHISEEKKYIITWGEFDDSELSRPLLVTCREI